MGKKRRPNRKPNYEDLGDIQDRMAGEAVTDEDVIRAMGENVLSELRGEVREDTLVQEAMDYLPQRRAELSAMAAPYQVDFINKNLKNEEDLVRMAKIDTYLSDLGRMQGDVPMPIDRKTDANDRNSDRRTRVHVEYDINPITGQEQVVPIADPRNTKQALKTEYGTFARGQVPDGFDEAIEHVGNNALMLMSRNPSGPNAIGDYGRADLRIDDGSDYGRRIDVEATENERFPDVIPMQAYTSLDFAPHIMGDMQRGGKNRWGGTRDEQMFKQDMKNAILNKARNENISGIEAVERLVSEGVLRDRRGPTNHPIRFGKVLKGELESPSNNIGVERPEHIYEGVIVPGFDSQERYRHGDVNRKTLVQPPDTLHMLDINKAKELLMSQKGDQRNALHKIDLNRRINYGARGDGYARQRMYYDIPYSSGSVEDLSVTSPIVQQLLSNEAMKRRLIN